MKIGIIGAMPEEIALLIQEFDYSLTVIGKTKIYSGNLGHHEVFVVQSGIGTAAAAISTTLLIQEKHPELIINIGTAGSVSKELNIGDLVLATSIAYYTADVTAFGYAFGQLPNCPARFMTDKKITNVFKQVLPNVKTGLVCSSDKFCNSDAMIASIKEHFSDALAVEMEAAAVAQTCFIFEVPFVLLRSISDYANGKSDLDFNKFIDLASANNAKAIVNVLANL